MTEHTYIERAFPIADHTGRTLEGVALYWDRPSRVTDDGSNYYVEEYAPTSANKTVADRAKRPVGILHPWGRNAQTSPIPLGAVSFEVSSEALIFRAELSKTQAADEALELVRDGALSDVSIGTHILRNSTRYSPHGPVQRREEIRLRELSLVPTGMAQHDGAKVLVTRAQYLDEGTPLKDKWRKRRSSLLLPM